MAKFKIGQRVKKVRGSSNIGITGVVVGLYCMEPGSYPNGTPFWENINARLLRSSDVQIKMDQSWKSTSGSHTYEAATVSYGNSEEWEPIIPDGSAPSTWEECLWQPEENKEKVRA